MQPEANRRTGDELNHRCRKRTLFLRLTLLVAFILTTAPATAGEATRLYDGFPTCAEARAVGPAIAAHRRGDYREIERLGCVPYTPDEVMVQVLRCAPSVFDFEPAWFSYPIEQDAALPEDVCEIQAWLPNGWTAILYTKFMNVWGSN